MNSYCVRLANHRDFHGTMRLAMQLFHSIEFRNSRTEFRIRVEPNRDSACSRTSESQVSWWTWRMSWWKWHSVVNFHYSISMRCTSFNFLCSRPVTRFMQSRGDIKHCHRLLRSIWMFHLVRSPSAASFTELNSNKYAKVRRRRGRIIHYASDVIGVNQWQIRLLTKETLVSTRWTFIASIGDWMDHIDLIMAG